MPRARSAAAMALLSGCMLALVGCHVRAHDSDGRDTDISINGGNATDRSEAGGQSVAIDVPGFSAKVDVPDLDIGDDTKIEDMPLYPGTRVNGVNVSAHDGGDGGESKGDVTMAFTAPAEPARMIAWYKDQAGKHGWSVVPASGENQLEATRQGDGHGTTRFALQVASATGGSSGRFIVTGR